MARKRDTSPRIRGPVVTPQERRRLAECCAFFAAARYRMVEPETIRVSDVMEAEAQITEVIERCGYEVALPP